MLAPLIYFNNWMNLETQERVYLNYSLNKNHLAVSETFRPLWHGF